MAGRAKANQGYYIDPDSIESGICPLTGEPYQFYRMVRLASERRNQ